MDRGNYRINFGENPHSITIIKQFLQKIITNSKVGNEKKNEKGENKCHTRN